MKVARFKGTLMDTFTSRTVITSFVTIKIVALIALCSVVAIEIVEGHTDSDLEEYLKHLNKPAIKTMKTEDGDIIDCVDIYKQRAFDHPLLKNHTIQMKPSSMPRMDDHVDDDDESATKQASQKFASCPRGTVPIRRTQMSDLRRVESLLNFGRRYRDVNEQAGGMTSSSGPFHGARARINVWNIPAESNEWSHSAIEISDTKNNYVEAGWTVNPQLYGDGKTRTYVYWTADGYSATGCYNLLCPGFVQVSRRYALGLPIHPMSTYDGDQYYILTTIYKDSSQMNWWLMIGAEAMGYWPGDIFRDYSFEQASEVKWVGSVHNTWNGGHHTTTQMGSGHLPAQPYGLFGKAAFFKDVRIVDNFHQLVRADGCLFYATNPDCYNVVPYYPKLLSFDFFIYYGGPGGLC